jgi:hypothetical protein
MWNLCLQSLHTAFRTDSMTLAANSNFQVAKFFHFPNSNAHDRILQIQMPVEGGKWMWKRASV